MISPDSCVFSSKPYPSALPACLLLSLRLRLALVVEIYGVLLFVSWPLGSTSALSAVRFIKSALDPSMQGQQAHL